MLLRALARREDSRGDGMRADKFVHRPVEPVDVEKVVLLAFRKQDVLLDIVQDAVERVLCDGGEKVERRRGAGNVHSLDNAPFEYGARQALPGDNGFSLLAVSSLEQRYELLRLARPHLLERHVET